MTALPCAVVSGCFDTFGIMRSVSIYLLWTSDLHDLSRASTQSSLSTQHLGAVAQHGDTDEGIAVGVPVDNRFVVLPWAAGNPFICLSRHLFGDRFEYLFLLVLTLSGDVDVGDLEVHFWNQLNAGNL